MEPWRHKMIHMLLAVAYILNYNCFVLQLIPNMFNKRNKNNISEQIMVSNDFCKGSIRNYELEKMRLHTHFKICMYNVIYIHIICLPSHIVCILCTHIS